jgi:hypothetical protein
MKQPTYRRACFTRFLGPTDHRDSRVKATHCATRKSVTLSWDHALGTTANHALAAARVLGTEDLLCCSIDGGGYVFMASNSSHGAEI